MTLYLLDVNVLQEMQPGGNPRVLAWRKGVDDSDLRISAVTLMERRQGRVATRKDLVAKGKSTAIVDAQIAALDAMAKEFADRTIAIDGRIAEQWSELLGAKRNNMLDMALAATARVHDLVVVTRNTKDFEGRGVRVLDPFVKTPAIRSV